MRLVRFTPVRTSKNYDTKIQKIKVDNDSAYAKMKVRIWIKPIVESYPSSKGGECRVVLVKHHLENKTNLKNT